MHLSTLSLLFLAALAAALPQPVSPSHPFTLATHETSNSFADYAFEKCKELGIDPHGKHPDDFTSDDSTGRHFEAGSKYALWVAAQNSEKMRKLERKLGRRKDHGISVTYVNPGTAVVEEGG
jgi:hypothetical protein